jgi:hypothetical protein
LAAVVPDLAGVDELANREKLLGERSMAAVNHAYVNLRSRDRASRGMRIREITTLPADATVFRFVNDAQSAFASGRLDANWWWWRTEVSKSFREARDRNSQIAEAIRRNGAIISAFKNGCAVMVVATCVHELKAYCGPGKAVDGSGALHGRATTPPSLDDLGIPTPSFDQLFIPGLDVPGNAAQWLKFERAVSCAYATTLMHQGVSPFELLRMYSP